MPKTETTERASQTSDHWYVSGFTTVLVSGLLTISWRAYTAGKIPFWSAWPGILGVAVVFAGFFMVAAGAAFGQAGKGSGRVGGTSDSNSSDQDR
jgi:uncharacterized membrane protein YdcZ (DUF606 family)